MTQSFNYKYEKCKDCDRRRKYLNNRICHLCYKAKAIFVPSENKVIDDFIKSTLIKRNKTTGRMEFVPYDRFKDIEFIAEGGFGKVYKATWIDGPIHYWDKKIQNYRRNGQMTVALKKLNNSKNINSKKLNEVTILNQICLQTF